MTAIITREPLTYPEPEARASVSWIGDLVARKLHTDPRATERLDRHRAEMDVLRREANERALRGLRSAEIEVRTEPGRTVGYGGYFSPPWWWEAQFVTANRAAAVTASLVNHQPLADGIGSVHIPVLSTGTNVAGVGDTAAVPTADGLVDTSTTSNVVTIAGIADVSLQALEQSPQNASLDMAFATDLGEAYGAAVETQLYYGAGSTAQELTGLSTLSGITSTVYTSDAPSGSTLWPMLMQCAATVSDARKQPIQAWFMRSARHFWLMGQEDSQGRPFGLAPFYLGRGDPSSADPVSGLAGHPVFLSEAISSSLVNGTTTGCDEIYALRPSDIMLLEAPPVIDVFREVLSGSLGARIRFHARCALLTRRVSAVGRVTGSGMQVASSY